MDEFAQPHFFALCRFEQDDGFGNLIEPPRSVESSIRLSIWEGKPAWEDCHA